MMEEQLGVFLTLCLVSNNNFQKIISKQTLKFRVKREKMNAATPLHEFKESFKKLFLPSPNAFLIISLFSYNNFHLNKKNKNKKEKEKKRT